MPHHTIREMIFRQFGAGALRRTSNDIPKLTRFVAAAAAAGAGGQANEPSELHASVRFWKLDAHLSPTCPRHASGQASERSLQRRLR